MSPAVPRLLPLFLAPALIGQAIDSSNVLSTSQGRGGIPVTQGVLYGGAFSYDVAYDTLPHACQAASSAARILVISKAWSNVPSLECAAHLAFLGGGRIQLAAGAIMTTLVPAICGDHGFDVRTSGPGSVLFTADPFNLGSNPRCFGAAGDGRHDDTLAIQAAIDAVAGLWNGATGYPATTFVVLPAGAYVIMSQLRIYKAGAPHAGAQSYEHFSLRGAGKAVSVIYYTGSRMTPAIRAIGAEMLFADFAIVDRNSSGWVSALDYDGAASIGRSTQSTIENVMIDCESYPGDGITIGRSLFQADSLSIYHPEIRRCSSGRGVVTLNGNALSTVLYHAVIGQTWIGAMSGTSTNMSIIGGEFDDNDVNFMPGAGSVFLVEGVRSEGSKRTLFAGVGHYPQNVTLQSYQLSSNNVNRRSIKTTAIAGASQIALTGAGFTFGDYIVIAGAGPNGADLHTEITSMSTLTDVTINPPVVAGVREAAVSLDETVNQNTLEENGGGPYVHIGNVFGAKSGATTSIANGTQVFIGNSWTMNIADPFGSTATSPKRPPGQVILFGNWSNASPLHMMPNVAGEGAASK
jgi:Pectate lyase superfamily protein